LDVLLLDLGLPDGDGGDLLRTVRAQYALPVLIISARHDDTNKVALLDAGADDYLVKPFSISELLARMRVTLRHRGTVVLAPQTQYRAGALEIDLAKHAVRLAGEPVHLTPTEFKLLARLVHQAGQVVTHRQLLVDVWGAEHVDQTHYLRLYMGQLRAKLEANPTEPVLLLTEPGVGYRLAE
jgi:two-component system KDP operon response regulator KdpE